MAYIDKTYIRSYQEYKDITAWCKEQGTVTDDYGNKFHPYDWIPHMYEYDEDFNSTDLGEYTEEYINKRFAEIRKHWDEKCKNEEYWKAYIGDNEEAQEKYPTLEKFIEYVDSWVPELYLWNTSTYFDIWLIRNCPIDFIQERLKVQYGGGWSKETFTNYDSSYEAIKNRTSQFDTFQRNGVKNPKFTIKYKSDHLRKFKDDKINWWIKVDYTDSDGCCNNLDYDEAIDQWFFYEECHKPVGFSITNVCTTKKGNMPIRRIRRILNKWNLPKGTVVEFSGTYKRCEVKAFNVIIK